MLCYGELVPLIMETDSLMAVNCVYGRWEIPWRIKARINKINKLRRHREIEIQHVWREGNNVADYFANLVFFFAGIEKMNFQSNSIGSKARSCSIGLRYSIGTKHSNHEMQNQSYT